MKALKYLWINTIISIFLIASFFWVVVCVPKQVFYEAYQSFIQDKFKSLLNTDKPKIILVGGSNLAFGIDNDLLAAGTEYEVVNLGLHAGFGQLFVCELSKANINPGDIVILSCEHYWPNDGAFDSFGSDLVMSGIDDEISMYKYIPKNKWKSVIGYLPEFAKKKNEAMRKGVEKSKIFSRDSFSPDTLNYIADRPECIINIDEVRGSQDAADIISEKSIKYLKKYKEYVEQQGASVYFADTPILDISLNCDVSKFEKLHNMEESMIGIPYITNQRDYLFSTEYIFDSINHCNNAGQRLRTELLIRDIKREFDK